MINDVFYLKSKRDVLLKINEELIKYLDEKSPNMKINLNRKNKKIYFNKIIFAVWKKKSTLTR